MPISQRIMIMNIFTGFLLIVVGISESAGNYKDAIERIEGIVLIAIGAVQIMVVLIERKRNAKPVNA